jgi:hypothetical protein
MRCDAPLPDVSSPYAAECYHYSSPHVFASSRALDAPPSPRAALLLPHASNVMTSTPLSLQCCAGAQTGHTSSAVSAEIQELGRAGVGSAVRAVGVGRAGGGAQAAESRARRAAAAIATFPHAGRPGLRRPREHRQCSGASAQVQAERSLLRACCCERLLQLCVWQPPSAAR